MSYKEAPNNDLNGNGEIEGLSQNTPWEMQWVDVYPDGQNIPGSLKFAEDFIRKIPIGSKLLDIGTGSGEMVDRLVREKQVDATGIDINKAAMAIAKIKYGGDNARFYTLNGHDLEKKFHQGDFSVVTMRGIIGGVESCERDRIMKKTYDVLIDGGMVGLAEFKFNSDPNSEPEDVQKYKEGKEKTGEDGTRIIKIEGKKLFVKHFTEDELIELLSRAGFVNIQTRGELTEGPGIADKSLKFRRQYTVWGYKPPKTENN